VLTDEWFLGEGLALLRSNPPAPPSSSSSSSLTSKLKDGYSASGVKEGYAASAAPSLLPPSSAPSTLAAPLSQHAGVGAVNPAAAAPGSVLPQPHQPHQPSQPPRHSTLDIQPVTHTNQLAVAKHLNPTPAANILSPQDVNP